MNGDKSMKKRIISMLFAGILCASSIISVSAATETEFTQTVSNIALQQQYMSLINTLDYEVELERAESGISDVPITQEILDNCIATSTDENGNVVNLDVKVTIRDLGTVTRSVSEEGEHLYALTAVASETVHNDDNVTKDGITAYGTLIWIDHLGINNELFGVTGQWLSDMSGYPTGRQVMHGVVGGNSVTTYPTINAFSHYGSGLGTFKGFALFLETHCRTRYGSDVRLRIISH